MGEILKKKSKYKINNSQTARYQFHPILITGTISHKNPHDCRHIKTGFIQPVMAYGVKKGTLHQGDQKV